MDWCNSTSAYLVSRFIWIFTGNTIIVHVLTMISESLILKPTCFYLYVLMVACYELMILCLCICKLFLYSFLGKDTYYVRKLFQVEKTNQSDFNDEILRNIGGKSNDNLNEILNNFTDTDFEIDTFSESPYIYWFFKWRTDTTHR